MEIQNVSGLSSTSTSFNINSLNVGDAVSMYDTFKDGFVGMDINGIENLCHDLDSITLKMDQILSDAIQMENLVDNAIKGESGERLKVYIQKVKELVLAYSSNFKNLSKIARSAAEAMVENDRGNAQIIEEATQNISQMANQMEID